MIKDKNIDPTAKFACQPVMLGVSGTATTAANLDVWIAPFACKVMYAVLSSIASTSATGTINVVAVTTAATTAGTSIFSAAGTMTATTQSVLDASSLLTTSAANGGVAVASGQILALQSANAVLTRPKAIIYIRPLSAKELSGY